MNYGAYNTTQEPKDIIKLLPLLAKTQGSQWNEFTTNADATLSTAFWPLSENDLTIMRNLPGAISVVKRVSYPTYTIIVDTIAKFSGVGKLLLKTQAWQWSFIDADDGRVAVSFTPDSTEEWRAVREDLPSGTHITELKQS